MIYICPKCKHEFERDVSVRQSEFAQCPYCKNVFKSEKFYFQEVESNLTFIMRKAQRNEVYSAAIWLILSICQILLLDSWLIGGIYIGAFISRIRCLNRLKLSNDKLFECFMNRKKELVILSVINVIQFLYLFFKLIWYVNHNDVLVLAALLAILPWLFSIAVLCFDWYSRKLILDNKNIFNVNNGVFPAYHLFCSNCGTVLSAEQNYCNKCGHKL